MKYNELVLKRQSKARRSGRGISAGRGMTGGRGTKGQGSRKSGGVRPGFEGGQMPLYMRLPQLRGFRSHKKTAEVVYTGQLEKTKGMNVDNQSLFEIGLASSPYVTVKLLLKGDISTKKNVKLQAASAKAVTSVEKAGGSFTKIARQSRPAKQGSKEPAK